MGNLLGHVADGSNIENSLFRMPPLLPSPCSLPPVPTPPSTVDLTPSLALGGALLRLFWHTLYSCTAFFNLLCCVFSLTNAVSLFLSSFSFTHLIFFIRMPSLHEICA